MPMDNPEPAEQDPRHVLMMPIGTEDMEKPGDVNEAMSWIVSIAAPGAPGTQSRIHVDLARHLDDPFIAESALSSAVRDAFARMEATGLPLVLDAADVRIFADRPVDACCRMTEKILEGIDEGPAEDFRDDDFENHPLADLREAMVDACPEYSGQDPEDPDP